MYSNWNEVPNLPTFSPDKAPRRSQWLAYTLSRDSSRRVLVGACGESTWLTGHHSRVRISRRWHGITMANDGEEISDRKLPCAILQ